ncbi:type IX secretion system membrane protein PorP/SprF [Aquimarina sp. MMG016]|uniref:PorP/SprF family type IX secretion system membrane protein n=1 Tax=Aquimarina sp. MMG016 TaxID=2822690 RepID=UPI001B3A2150|nr:type IX secretion system membrane protein PorP/SprF [Aquimarina sp. MMG016]MBQ4822000.1 type IX secretion system membrane protein PorP/SprF [Aquimarina sp. MMG016]
MKNLNYIFFVLALSLVVQTKAQQDPHFSLYKYNMNIVNPAYAGTEGNLEALFGVRSQWTGIKDAPETFNFNVNSPVGRNVGLGLSAVTDRVFVVSETHIYADFSYKIKITDVVDLFAGIKAGGSFLDVDLNGLVADDPLFTENISNFNPNVGVGFYLKAPKYYVTVSAPGLLKNDRFEKEGVVPVSANDNVHFFTGAGYDFNLSDSFMLKPSAMAKFVSGAPVSVDLTASMWYKKRLELGINYRLDESYTGFLTMEFLDHLRIGYAFERATTDINTFSNGTHEVVLKLLLRNKKKAYVTETKL